MILIYIGHTHANLVTSKHPFVTTYISVLQLKSKVGLKNLTEVIM